MEHLGPAVAVVDVIYPVGALVDGDGIVNACAVFGRFGDVSDGRGMALAGLSRVAGDPRSSVKDTHGVVGAGATLEGRGELALDGVVLGDEEELAVDAEGHVLGRIGGPDGAGVGARDVGTVGVGVRVGVGDEVAIVSVSGDGRVCHQCIVNARGELGEVVADIHDEVGVHEVLVGVLGPSTSRVD